MKLTILFTAALTASSALGFPMLKDFMGEDNKKLLDILSGQLKGKDQSQLTNLFAQIKEGMDQYKSVDLPKPSLINGKWNSMSQQGIYDAFGLQRTQDWAANDTSGKMEEHLSARQFDLGGWGPAENEEHPYIPPGPGDLRGPCPGLNTAANHGYLPRNGVVTPAQLFKGTWEALSLSPDLCAILAGVSFIFKGDLTDMTLSIGGQHGLGSGLSSHGVLEGDASVTRDDAWQGNQWSVNRARFDQFIDDVNQYGHGDVTPVALAQSRHRVWTWSRRNNPKFDFNPWRMIVAYGESGFVMEALRGDNKHFTPEMLHSWFIDERFPPGWRRRKIPVTTVEILAWAALIEALKPTYPGWNLNIKNLFFPVPTLGSLKALGTLFGGGSTIQGVGCGVAEAVLGWMPSTVSGLIGGLGISNLNGMNCK